MPASQRPEPVAAPPLSRPFNVDAQKEFPVDVDVVASSEECAALARAFNLPAVASMQARLRLTRAGARVSVTGAVDARVTQICVVSLDPFEAGVHEEVEGLFTPALAGRRGPEAREVVVVVDEDAPDPIIDGKIDLGVLATEFLALGVDPHPRKPGVEFTAITTPPEPPASPFAVLEQLKKPVPPVKK